MIANFHALSLFPLGEIFSFCLGLIWGSFLNVCIARIPEKKDLIFKPSHCPQCKKPIRWYHNVPLLSFLILRGKCAHCRKAISWEYPIVELLTGILFLFLYWKWGWSLDFLLYAIFICNLIVISFIDLHLRIIPDELSLGGLVVGFLASFLLGDILWWESLLGVLLGGGSFFAVAFLYEKLAHREGLGGGDIKLLAMLGAWLGYQSILPIIVISSALGSLIGIAILLRQKGNMKTAIPFGPFLALAGSVTLFYKSHLLSLFFPPLD